MPDVGHCFNGGNTSNPANAGFGSGNDCHTAYNFSTDISGLTEGQVYMECGGTGFYGCYGDYTCCAAPDITLITVGTEEPPPDPDPGVGSTAQLDFIAGLLVGLAFIIALKGRAL